MAQIFATDRDGTKHELEARERASLMETTSSPLPGIDRARVDGRRHERPCADRIEECKTAGICAALLRTVAAAALDIGVVRTIIGLYVTVHFLTQSRQR